MPVAVIDVGANTVRLLVIDGREEVLRRRAMLRLGEAIEEQGEISEAKLEETAACVAGYAEEAREAGAVGIEILVTSPARQATNGSALVDRLAAAADVPARGLSAAEEGRLAFLGALWATTGLTHKMIAVCDVGGGSAQITIGTRRAGVAWTRSIDIGSMRLTSRLLSTDPPGMDAVGLARLEVEQALEGVVPPLPHVGLAVGGSARALRALVGSRFQADELDQAVETLATTPGAEIVERYSVKPERVQTLTAGAIILSQVSRKLNTPLRVARGGLREGAARELEQSLLAAA